MTTLLPSAYSCDGNLFEWRPLIETLAGLLTFHPGTCVQFRMARPFSVWRVQRQSGPSFHVDIYTGGKRATAHIDSQRGLYENLQNLVLESFLDNITVFEGGQVRLVIPHARIVRNDMIGSGRTLNNSYYVPQQPL